MIKKIFYFYTIICFFYSSTDANAYDQMQLLHALSVNYIFKPSLQTTKKIFLERNEPAYCAGAFLVIDKCFIPKSTYEYMPILSYVKVSSQYIVTAWIFYTCLVGNSFEKIHQELVNLNKHNQTITEHITSVEQKTNNIYILDQDTNKKVTTNEKNIFAILNHVIKSFDFLGLILQTIEDTHSEMNNSIENIKDDIKLEINKNTNLILKEIRNKNQIHYE